MMAMTMKTGLILGGVALALGAVAWPAMKGLAANQNINLSANVTKFCKFDAAPTFSGLNNISVASNSIGTSVLNVNTATNASGIMANSGFTMAVNATCNHPSQVIMTTVKGGLKDSTPTSVSSGTFLNRLDYAALATWDGAPIGILSTNGTANTSSSPQLASGAHSGPLTVGVGFILNQTSPLLAGDYSDTLRISLSPQ
jgi:hypothetical protein